VAVLNVHTRELAVTSEQAGVLLDSLAGDTDRLWPGRTWPAMRFDRPLAVGAIGGHGPIRYRIEAYVPGVWIRFRFTAPRGFDGFHEYTVRETPDGHVTMQHLCAMRLRGSSRLSWPLFYRPMHDALIEDSIDLAEQAGADARQPVRRWTCQVRLLRALAGSVGRAARAPGPRFTPRTDARSTAEERAPESAARPARGDRR
jgi:hypothetical protein